MIEGYAKLSPQEKYDHVTRFQVAQGQPSMRPSPYSACLYRTPDGLACAAGCLVPGTEVDRLDEGMSWADQASDIVEDIGDELLITAMQEAHDGAAGYTDGWRHNFVRLMRGVAEEFELSTAVLDELATEEWQKAGV